MDTFIKVLKESNLFLLEKAFPPCSVHSIDSCMNKSLEMAAAVSSKTNPSLPAPAIGIIVFVSIAITILLLIQFVLLPSSSRKRGYLKLLLRHAVVTGGSSGIGLSIAQELVRKQCCYITLIARGENKLKEAQAALQALAKDINSPTIISIYPVDVSNASAMQHCAQDVCSDTNKQPPTLLFNVAGTATAKDFIKTNPAEFERLMSLNYLGSVYTTHAFLPFMLGTTNHTTTQEAKKLSKTIVFTSSAAGQVGVYGYSAYSPTKYALRGLAEVLQMELLRENIFVQVAYPPDTDTPGYQLEQIDKPKETQLISEAAGLFKPEVVAKGMVSAAIAARPPFFVSFGVEGWLLATLSSGMSPAHRFVDAVAQILFMGFFRFLSLFFLMDFRRIVAKVGATK